ncbi:MAG: hypothetical protein AAFN07_15580 [Pseudomonadota bacterium]
MQDDNTTAQWRRIRELFREARQQPPTCQVRFIAQSDVDTETQQEALELLHAAKQSDRSFRLMIAEVLDGIKPLSKSDDDCDL